MLVKFDKYLLLLHAYDQYNLCDNTASTHLLEHEPRILQLTISPHRTEQNRAK